MILALAIRTASVLGDCFFGGRGGVSAPAVGIMSNCVGAIEPCATGCMVIGPVDAAVLLGIIDNARAPSSFDAGNRRTPRVTTAGYFLPPTGVLAKSLKCWQEWQGSNLQPPVLETGALPVELHS